MEKIERLDEQLHLIEYASLVEVINDSQRLGFLLGISAEKIPPHGIEYLGGTENGKMSVRDISEMRRLTKRREYNMTNLLIAGVKRRYLIALSALSSEDQAVDFLFGLERSFNKTVISEYEDLEYRSTNELERFSRHSEDYFEKFSKYQKLLEEGWGQKAPKLKRTSFTTLSDYKPAKGK